MRVNKKGQQSRHFIPGRCLFAAALQIPQVQKNRLSYCQLSKGCRRSYSSRMGLYTDQFVQKSWNFALILNHRRCPTLMGHEREDDVPELDWVMRKTPERARTPPCHRIEHCADSVSISISSSVPVPIARVVCEQGCTSMK